MSEIKILDLPERQITDQDYALIVNPDGTHNKGKYGDVAARASDMLLESGEVAAILNEAQAAVDNASKYSATGRPVVPTSNINTDEQLVRATQAGTYTNFGGLTVATEELEGFVNLVKIGGTWSKDVKSIDSGLSDEVDLLKGKVSNLDLESGYLGAWKTDDDIFLFGSNSDNKFEVNEYLERSIPAGAIESNSITASELSAEVNGQLGKVEDIQESQLSDSLKDKINGSSWPSNAFEAFRYASSRRIDVVMFSDSNGKFDGDGFDAGMNYALSERYAQYASPLYSARNGIAYEGVAFTTGFGVSHTVAGSTDAIPSGFNEYLLPTPGKECAYNLDGDFASDTGMIKVNFNSPLGANNLLRAHFKVIKFPGGGTFRPGWRRETSPYTILSTGTAFSFADVTTQEAYHTVDLPAGERGFDVAVKYRLPSGAAAVGPNMIISSRVEKPDSLAGYSVSHFYAVGGQSLWDMAEFIRTNTLESIGNYFSEIRRLQVLKGQKPIIIIYINSAVNDQNETSTPSQGWRESTSPQTATAYIDNLEYLVDRLEQAYQFKGFDVNELFFFIMPSHPVSTPDAAKLISFRKAAQSFSTRPRCSFVDITTVTSSTEISTNNWYKELAGGADDVNHLVLAGNTEILRRIFNKYIPVI